MSQYRQATFPPHGPWDLRLTDVVCTGLQPVARLHENPWFSVQNRGGYFTVENHLRNVAVLPIVGGDSVVMVRVKRPVVDDLTLELPAGGIEPNEEPVGAAARELVEEAGVDVPDTNRFIAMPPIALSSTRMPQLSYIFRVDLTECEYASRRSHDEEIHSVERIPIVDLPAMMARGEIYVAIPLSVIGIFLVTRQS